ncbi:DNA recombination protein RmuC [Anaerolinea sp.]|uniref:DNA recombination protein RmuC n=1 Tax=Anaerolinea sp. TaxID=1872519 RepID=UPI002ACDBBA5|nr:DNA recombination protein RmuC [Anaerolinea sp.]
MENDAVSTLTFLSAVSLLLLCLLIPIVGFLLFQMRKLLKAAATPPAPSPEMAVLKEKISQVETLIPSVSALQSEVRGLSERILSVENTQTSTQQGVGALSTQALSALAELKTLTGGIAEAASRLRADLSQTQNRLSELQAFVRAREEEERQMAESVRRLETIIAGTQSKGKAGENIVEVVFSKFPPEWQERNLKVNGKTVEFALRLPNQRFLPIDSKWAATSLVEEFARETDEKQLQRLRGEIEKEVSKKLREVTQYIDPDLTVNFGVAVVPDAVYEVCGRVHAEAFKMNVVLVSYSLFVPYLLLVYQVILKNAQTVDMEALSHHLERIQKNVEALQNEVNGRLSKGLTLLVNSRDEMKSLLGSINDSIASLKVMEHSALPEGDETATPLD